MERSKPTALLIFVAILSLYVEEGCCLYCLSCTGISQPRHCHVLQQCNSEQSCALEKFTDQFGDVYFDVGCMDNKQCQANHTLTHGMQCLGCCDNDMCNSNLCGASGYPNQMGLICFSCKSMLRDRQCRNIEFCQENEVCFYREYEELGDMLIDTGCSTPQGCNTLESESNFNPGTIVGKRSETARSLTHVNCTSCCSQHICNDDCFGARDCLEIQTYLPSARTGPYNIKMRNGKKVKVWCDMTTDGGGWTVFQKRYDGSVDFYRGFAEYTNGFGSVDGEFWLGLENIFQLTIGHNNSFRVDIVDRHGKTYEQLSSFNIDAGPAYTLHVGGVRTGTAGRQILYYDGRKFTTKDRDQDTNGFGNCAEVHRGAFWYFSCIGFANPNGLYRPGEPSYLYMSYSDYYGCSAMQMKFRRNEKL